MQKYEFYSSVNTFIYSLFMIHDHIVKKIFFIWVLFAFFIRGLVYSLVSNEATQNFKKYVNSTNGVDGLNQWHILGEPNVWYEQIILLLS